MEGKQLLHRLIAMNAKINLHNIRSGNIDDDNWDKLTDAAGFISQYNLIIDDTPGLTTFDIEQKLTQIVAKHGKPSLVLIDYLQF
ncbi:replicative DNA helicase, partial [Pseudomonas aeruginosa]